MEEFEKPDTSHLVLKPKEIVPTDRRALPGDGTAISVQLIHGQNRIAEEKASEGKRRGRPAAPAKPAAAPPPPGFKAAEIERVNPAVRPDDEEAISVPEILKENKIAEVESGLADVKPPQRRKSRRNRDFILLVGTIDTAIIIYMRVMQDTVAFVYGIAGITLVTSMSAWIMYVVNEDY
jgi:hypothetical protein